MIYDKGIDFDTNIKVIDLAELFGKGNEIQIQLFGDNAFIVHGETDFIRESETDITYTGLTKATSGYRVSITDPLTKLRNGETLTVYSENGTEKANVIIYDIKDNYVFIRPITPKVDLNIGFTNSKLVSLRDTKLYEGNIFSIPTTETKKITVKSEGSSSLEITSFLKKKS